MWLNIGFCISLFYVVKTQSNTPNDEPEQGFVDVIKNISRVNNVLQELISNYETLQKIYKSQENLDSSKYSDSDIDELFQNIKKTPRTQTSKATKKEKFAATEMYWSDHDEDTKKHYNDANVNQPEKHLKRKGNVVDKDKNVVRRKPKTTTTTPKPGESSSEFSDSGEYVEKSEPVEKMLKKKILTLPKYAKKNDNIPIPKSNKAHREFDDSYAISAFDKLLSPFVDTKAAQRGLKKNYIDKEKYANRVASDVVKAVDVSKNTRKVQKNFSPQADVSNNMRYRTHMKKNSKDAITTKKTFYDLVVKDKPIQMEAHSEMFIENVERPDINSEKKNTEKRRDIVQLAKINRKHHHKNEDIDKVAVNETHHKLLRTETNVTHHKTKKNLKEESIDHETYNTNQKMVDNDKEARDTDNDNKKTHDDNKTANIGYKMAPNDNKKTNKRQKETDIEPEISYIEHKMVNNNEEQRGTVAKSKKKKKLYQESQVESSDESSIAFMNKNYTHVLREAYGEACMKVVVRKCYKACTRSTKLVCSQTKCKSALKSSVKEHAKTGCLERFTAKELSATKSDLENDRDLFVHKRRALQENFNNLNEREFHACLPTLSVQTELTLKPSTNESNSPSRKMKQKTTDVKVSFNILRDRFERACKKLSYEKCRDACTCSWNSACTTLDCSKRLKTLYKKSCKNTCRNAYELGKQSDSGSSSSSSDDSSNSS